MGYQCLVLFLKRNFSLRTESIFPRVGDPTLLRWRTTDLVSNLHSRSRSKLKILLYYRAVFSTESFSKREDSSFLFPAFLNKFFQTYSKQKHFRVNTHILTTWIIPLIFSCACLVTYPSIYASF